MPKISNSRKNVNVPDRSLAHIPKNSNRSSRITNMATVPSAHAAPDCCAKSRGLGVGGHPEIGPIDIRPPPMARTSPFLSISLHVEVESLLEQCRVERWSCWHVAFRRRSCDGMFEAFG